MSNDMTAYGAAVLGTAYAAYQVVNGKFGKALLVPAVAYGLSKVGDYTDLKMISQLGETVLFSLALAAPGTALGSAIHLLGGKTVPMKVIACVAGSAITYKVIDAVADFAARSVARVSL